MKYLIKNTRVINEGTITEADVLIDGQRISKIAPIVEDEGAKEIDGEGKFLMPGMIDDQVHFREPGLTHKAEIRTESRAAVAGGITSFMEMPNTVPNVLSQELLEDKYKIASKDSLANYSFFMGVSNDNRDEVLKTDPKKVCGIKIFMGSSTGNMLVDDERTLNDIFKNAPTIIATHCEDEQTIRHNLEVYKKEFGEDIPFSAHPSIRNEEACYLSSSFAVELAKKHGTRLHVLHISTEKELSLFETAPIQQKKITAEACVHHLWFSDADYGNKGALIKWNPAVKKASDREAIRKAVMEGPIDVLATDHAPHTVEEKQGKYNKAPSGGPLVQHALPAYFELWKQGIFSLEKIVEKACHNPALLFQIKDRGFVREGFYADLVLMNPNKNWVVSKDNIRYKCGWSPFEGNEFSTSIDSVFVSGHPAYNSGQIQEGANGERLVFDR